MKKLILKNPLYTVVAAAFLAGLFIFTFYYFSHDTAIIPDQVMADSFLAADEEE